MSATACSITILNPDSEADGAGWDAFVASRPDATPAHRFGWLRVIKDSFGHKVFPLAVSGPDGRVRGVLPLIRLKSRLFGTFLVSVPFLNYGGVLAEDAPAGELLLTEADRLMRENGASHVELRQAGRGVAELPTRSHKVSMHLPLADDEDAQWKALDAKVRNQVRKAVKSGLSARIGGSELLDGFYGIFARNMRDLGTPVYAKSFFAHVLEKFPGQSSIILVTGQDRDMAAGLTVWDRGRLEIPWASSIREFNALCPNNLLYWEAIKQAIGLGLACMDFGRSSPDSGTYKFKAQWGAKPLALHWQYLLAEGRDMPDLTPANPRYQAAIRLWKRLPVPVTKAIGPWLVRNIP